MNIQKLTQIKDFYTISKDFSDNSYDLKTVSSLISKIRYNFDKLEKHEIESLLGLVINIFEDDVTIENEVIWARRNANYFANNVIGSCIEKYQYFDNLSSTFSSGNYSLETVIDLIKKVNDDSDSLVVESEFLLRIPEVTIQDDAKIAPYSNFEKCGLIFSKVINDTFKI